MSPIPHRARVHAGDLVGSSLPMQRLHDLIERVARSTVTVVITGERGSGKKAVAAAIHAASRRSGQFVVCDVGALTEDSIERVLFGHMRGAFTGATAHRAGVVEGGVGGTVLLDRLGEVPLGAQARLLRLVERREVRPYGSNRARVLDLRLLATSLQPLWRLVAEGRFRADLLHRLGVITIEVPPLRDRLGDLGALSADLLKSLAPDASYRLDADALALLGAHAWPGNVRELRDLLARVVSRVPPGPVNVAALLACGDLVPAKPHRAKELANERWQRVYLQQLLELTRDQRSR